MTAGPYTYDAFMARATKAYGESEARRICPVYGRVFARDCRERAATANAEDADTLHRLADQMDPDLRDDKGVPGAAP